MTKEAFESRIRYEIKGNIPFIAYWYRFGYGLLRTGPVTVIDANGKPRLKTVSAATIKKWNRNLEKLRRWSCFGFGSDFITINFNGTDLFIEGGELNL